MVELQGESREVLRIENARVTYHYDLLRAESLLWVELETCGLCEEWRATMHEPRSIKHCKQCKHQLSRAKWVCSTSYPVEYSAFTAVYY